MFLYFALFTLATLAYIEYRLRELKSYYDTAIDDLRDDLRDEFIDEFAKTNANVRHAHQRVNACVARIKRKLLHQTKVKAKYNNTNDTTVVF